MPKTAQCSHERKFPAKITGAAAPSLSEPEHAPLLLESAGSAKPIRVRRNQDVIVAGRTHGCIYVNHDGWLFRYKILHDGSRQIIDFILPGQIFGLQCCLFKRPLYSVATVTDTSLSPIPLAVIRDVFDRNPAFAKALFRSAICESVILAEHLTDAARRSAYERVSHFLLELFVRLAGVGLTDGMTLFLPLTQDLIADALGLTTVHVNRTFRSLRDDKLIATAGRLVTILDFEALSLVSDFENSYLGETARIVRGGAPGEEERRPAKTAAAASF